VFELCLVYSFFFINYKEILIKNGILPELFIRYDLPVQGGTGCRKRSFVMKNLMLKEGREIESGLGVERSSTRVDKYKQLISDESYIDFAITRIATDLSHYLTK